VDRQKWLRRPIAIFLICTPLAILLAVPTEHWAAALLAFLNASLIFGAIAYFARQRTFEAMLPIFFLVWQLMQFPIGTLYFAVVMPEAYYEVSDQKRFYLEDNWKVQLALLLFLFAFLTPQLFAIRKRRGEGEVEVDRQSAIGMSTICLAMVLVAIGSHMLASLRLVPGLEYFSNGAVIYMNGMMFVLGVFFSRMPMGMRGLVLIILMFVLGFYAIANARSQAIQPVVFMLAGMLFVSRMNPRVKNLLVIGFMVFFPVFMVVGNTTRHLLNRAGGYENIGQRIEAMGRWEESLRKQPVMFSTITRLFSTGGHSLITKTPEPVYYLGFSAIEYAEELLITAFVPGILYHKSFYSTSFQLKRYNFYITDKTSVEMSMVGSLWMINGPIAVFFGGLFVGLINAALGVMISRLRRRTPNRALFLFAMLAPGILFGSQYDAISYFNKAVRSTIFGHVLYFVAILPLVREPRPGQPPAVRSYPGVAGSAPPPYGLRPSFPPVERGVSAPAGSGSSGVQTTS
jgi:hypothetical protein